MFFAESAYRSVDNVSFKSAGDGLMVHEVVAVVWYTAGVLASASASLNVVEGEVTSEA